MSKHDQSALDALILHHEISAFLYWEAALLDDRRYDDWFKLLADDLYYFMPVRSTRMRREGAGEFGGADDVAHFDDDKASIWKRLRRLKTPQAWAEDPPSRTRHMLTNIQCTPIAASEVRVESCFYVYRSRAEHTVETFVGGREDVLRRTGDERGWEIVKRVIRLDQTVVLANNISFFF